MSEDTVKKGSYDWTGRSGAIGDGAIDPSYFPADKIKIDSNGRILFDSGNTSIDGDALTTGLISSNEMCTDGVTPVFTLDLDEGDISILDDSGDPLFEFDKSAQTLTVHGTIYADAGEFAGELNGAYGRIGGISSDAKYASAVSWSSGTAESTILSWWKTNISTAQGSIFSVLGTYGANTVYAAALNPDTADQLDVFHSDGTLVINTSGTIGSALAFDKVYDKVYIHGQIIPSVADMFDLGTVNVPFQDVCMTQIILRDVTNGKRADLYVDDTYNGFLWIGYGSNFCRIGQYDATSLLLHSSGSQIRFGYGMSSKWSATWNGSSKTVIEGYSTNELIVNSSPVAIARGGAATEEDIFDTLSPVIPVGQYRTISGAVYASSNLYIFSHAYRYSSTQIRLFYIRSDGSQSYIAIVEDSADTHNISISV